MIQLALKALGIWLQHEVKKFYSYSVATLWATMCFPALHQSNDALQHWGVKNKCRSTHLQQGLCEVCGDATNIQAGEKKTQRQSQFKWEQCDNLSG